MSGKLHYKGFTGTVEFSETDKVFWGKIEKINGSVTFEGQSVAELEKDFHDAVENYLEYCEAHKISPYEKQFKGSFNIRIEPETHLKIVLKAKKKGISLNQLVKNALEKVANSD